MVDARWHAWRRRLAWAIMSTMGFVLGAVIVYTLGAIHEFWIFVGILGGTAAVVWAIEELTRDGW